MPYTTVPTYPSGQIGFVLCSWTTASGPRSGRRAPTTHLPLRYYNPDVHAASFILPEFAARERVAVIGAAGSQQP